MLGSADASVMNCSVGKGKQNGIWAAWKAAAWKWPAEREDGLAGVGTEGTGGGAGASGCSHMASPSACRSKLGQEGAKVSSAGAGHADSVPFLQEADCFIHKQLVERLMAPVAKVGCTQVDNVWLWA